MTMTSRIMALAVAGAAILSFGAAPTQPFGLCSFDPATLKFAGTPTQQSSCLLRKVRPKGTGSDVQPIPAWLASHVGQPIDIEAASLSQYLTAQGVNPADLGGAPVKGDAPGLRYFVIHDTSWPELTGVTTFPLDIDSPDFVYQGQAYNRFAGLGSLTGKVHLAVSRDGQSKAFTAWTASRTKPATKLEQNSVLPGARKAFAHVENVQPRIKPPGSFGWIAPKPGFSPAQEKRLALAYVAASLHAGRWLIPAYHFNVDQNGPGGMPHDDPQNTDLVTWGAAVEAVVGEIGAGN